MKSVDCWNVSPVEQELAFEAWRRDEEVDLILMDGDDTLWKTVPLFRKNMGLCYDFLHEKTGIGADYWKSLIEKINNRLFERYGVNPRRWELVMAEIEEECGLNHEIACGALEVLMNIYTEKPDFVKGTEEGFDFLVKSRVDFGIVTHANREWTKKKYRWLELGRFLPWESIFVVDENGHKTETEWKAACDYFGVMPRKVAIVGDSPRSDINPCQKIGVRNRFLIKNSEYGVWSIHQQGVGEDTRVINNIGQLKWLGGEMVHKRPLSENKEESSAAKRVAGQRRGR